MIERRGQCALDKPRPLHDALRDVSYYMPRGDGVLVPCSLMVDR